LRRKTVSDFDLAVASSRNIVKYLSRAANETQPSFFNILTGAAPE